MKNPLLDFLFAFLTLVFRSGRCYYTNPQPYNLSYVVRLLSNGQPDPQFTSFHFDQSLALDYGAQYTSFKWYKGSDVIGTDPTSCPAEEAGFYILRGVEGNNGNRETTVAARFVTDAMLPTTEAEAPTCWDQSFFPGVSFTPQFSGGGGGTPMYCVAGFTNWQTGPCTLANPGPNTDYVLYVATKCAPRNTGNANDPIQGPMMVNFQYYNLSADTSPR